MININKHVLYKYNYIRLQRKFKRTFNVLEYSTNAESICKLVGFSNIWMLGVYAYAKFGFVLHIQTIPMSFSPINQFVRHHESLFG